MMLKEGIERFAITNINQAGASNIGQSELACMFDNVSEIASNFNHVPGGANVLYMDGHVDFIKFPGELPVSQPWAYMMLAVNSAADRS